MPAADNLFTSNQCDKFSAFLLFSTSLAAANSLEPALELYPNPATDVLRFAFSNGTDATTVVVTDMRGVRLSVPATAGQLDVSALANGIYTLTLSDGKTVFHQRFVKQ